MLDNTVQGIELLAEDADQWHCPTLLDANVLDKLFEWLQTNPAYTGKLISKQWRIGVLRHHIELRPDAARTTKKLKALQIELLRYDAVRQRAFVGELQRAYFGNEADSDQTAELLAYGRTQSIDRKPIRIISRYRGLRLVPHIALYQVPLVDDVGRESNAAFLRMFEALKLHPKVEAAAYERIRNGDYPTALVETVKSFFEEMRHVGGMAHAPLRTMDGYQLVHQALDSDRKAKPPRPPHVQLNPLANTSEWNEQTGFHDIACGVSSALRNTIAHGPTDEPFIRERFGDRRTALKFLCLLSLLFEKLDKRVAP